MLGQKSTGMTRLPRITPPNVVVAPASPRRSRASEVTAAAAAAATAPNLPFSTSCPLYPMASFLRKARFFGFPFAVVTDVDRCAVTFRFRKIYFAGLVAKTVAVLLSVVGVFGIFYASGLSLGELAHLIRINGMEVQLRGSVDKLLAA